jgi:hypothetical protein
MRLFGVILAMMLRVVSLTFIKPFEEVNSDRMDSFTNLESDGSYNGRQGIYHINLPKVVVRPY